MPAKSVVTKQPFPWIHSGNMVSAVINGENFSISDENENFSDIIKHLKLGNWDVASELLSPAKRIANIAKTVVVKGGFVHYKGKKLHGSLTDRIVKMATEGQNFDSLARFIVRLEKNPTESAREELYAFMQANDLPITPLGTFRAYKIVTDDMKDVYTKRIDHSVGKIVSMARHLVDPDRNNTCSRGYHCCGWGYLASYSGEKVIEVEVDPQDVVAVPPDYNQQKMRVCKYRVVRVLGDRDVIRDKHVLKDSVVSNKLSRAEMIVELIRKLGKRKVNPDSLKKSSTARITKLYMKHFA